MTTAQESANPGRPGPALELLERVMAEARAVQAESPPDTTTWFTAAALAARMQVDACLVGEALSRLRDQGEIALAVFWRKDGEQAELAHVLADAVGDDGGGGAE